MVYEQKKILQVLLWMSLICTVTVPTGIGRIRYNADEESADSLADLHHQPAGLWES